MKNLLSLIFGALATLAMSGCSSTGHTEHGPNGTIAYYVKIESSDPGARVEVNNDYVGTAPMTLKIFGDKDGTFHNFGSRDYVIQVFPVKEGQHTQTKMFYTGGWWSKEDKIPSRLYFDLNDNSEKFSIDLQSPESHQQQK